jgi:polyhydroxyalkanoate synthesis regulator protein
VQAQSPLMQGLMGSYLDHSKTLFAQMQEQLQKTSVGLFPGMPGFPPKG